MLFSEAKLIAQALGFTRIADIRGNVNIAELFAQPGNEDEQPPLTGIYLQFRHDDSLYIGRTQNLVRRCEAHREAGVLVAFLAFRSVEKRALKSAEERCILKAREFDFDLTNIAINRETGQASDIHFDTFMPIDSQDNFIRDVIDGNTNAGHWNRFLKEASTQDRWDWDRFNKTSFHPVEQLYAARSYLVNAIPDPQACFGMYLRCTLPNPGRNSIVKTLTLIAGNFGVFEIYYYVRAPKQLWCNILLDPMILYQTYGSKEAIQEKFAWMTLEIPEKEEKKTVDELMDQGTVHAQAKSFVSPYAKAAFLSRHLTHVNVKNLATATLSIDTVETAMEDRVFATAAALAAVASMRYKKPVLKDNNRLLMYKLCPEVVTI